jgi:hypothetical protein
LDTTLKCMDISNAAVMCRALKMQIKRIEAFS